MFTPEIFDVLEHQNTGFNGEIQLTDAIDGLAKRTKVVAVDFEGRRFDTGSMTGYLETVLEYALESEKTGAWLKEYILKKAEEWK